MSEKLIIKYNVFRGQYELWRLIIDDNDKLYPVTHRWLEEFDTDKKRLKEYAQREFTSLSKYL